MSTSMNDPQELFAAPLPNGAAHARARRLSEPTRPSELVLHAGKAPTLTRRKSDPALKFSVFTLRNTLRPSPYTGGDEYGRRSSYADTSSATQSFVSFDPTDTNTPGQSTSAVGFSTESDADGDDVGPQQYRASTARSNTVHAPQTQRGARLDPRRAATMGPDPRATLTSNGPVRSFAGRDSAGAGSDGERIPDVVPEDRDRDRTVRRPEGTRDDRIPDSLFAGRRPGAEPPVSQTQRLPDSLYAGRRPAGSAQSQDGPLPNPFDAGSRPDPDGSVSQPQRRPTREPAQRRDARDMATPLAQEAAPTTVPSESPTDPRRTPKLSSTPTIVPSKPPADSASQKSRSRQRLPSATTAESQSRPRLPSGASASTAHPAPPTATKTAAPTAPPPPSPPAPSAAAPSAAAAEPRTPTTIRPSTASERKPAPAPATKPDLDEPRHPTTAAIAAIASQRPPLEPGMSQMDTKYVNMLLAIDSIPALHNILASFFTWILLAGFVLFPGTFTNLQQNNQLGALGATAVNVIRHLSLYVIAWVCTAVGAGGMCWLWWRWRKNYIWCLNKIFLPGLLNSLAGILSTLSSVLGTQGSTLSKSSLSTIIVTSATAGVCGALTAWWMFVLIRGIKKQHDREVGKQRTGKHGEGFADTSKVRKTV